MAAPYRPTTFAHRVTEEEATRAGITLGDHGHIRVQAHDWGGGVMLCTILRIHGDGTFDVSHYGRRYYRVLREDILGPAGPCGCRQSSAHAARPGSEEP